MLEKRLIQPEIRRSKQLLDQYLATDFMEIPSTGIPFNKKQALDRIPSEKNPDFHLQEFQSREITDSLIQLIYKAVIIREDGTKHYSIRQSIWQKIENNWQMLFHQATVCDEFEILLDNNLGN